MGVFLIPVYVKALLTVSDIRRRERGLSRLIYVIYSNGTKLVNQKKIQCNKFHRRYVRTSGQSFLSP